MLLVVVRRRVLAGGRAAVGLDLLLVVVGVGDGRVGGNGQSLSQSVSRLAPGGWAPITQAIHTYIHTYTDLPRAAGASRGAKGRQAPGWARRPRAP